jgi:hypothetical protein
MRLRSRHYWRKRLRGQVSRRLAEAVCDPAATIEMLSTAPRPRLSWLDRSIAFLTTPFKRLGIEGWKETGCNADGGGAPVRDAQHSTDGFWTIDLELASFAIGSDRAKVSPSRYLRLEVEPGTRAHALCSAAPVREGDTLFFGGAVVIDGDANFLEIHPDEDLRMARAAGP